MPLHRTRSIKKDIYFVSYVIVDAFSEGLSVVAGKFEIVLKLY